MKLPNPGRLWRDARVTGTAVVLTIGVASSATFFL